VSSEDLTDAYSHILNYVPEDIPLFLECCYSRFLFPPASPVCNHVFNIFISDGEVGHYLGMSLIFSALLSLCGHFSTRGGPNPACFREVRL